MNFKYSSFDKITVQMTSSLENENAYSVYVYKIFSWHENIDIIRHKLIFTQILMFEIHLHVYDYTRTEKIENKMDKRD